MSAEQQFSRNTSGTTADGTLDAIVALIDVLNRVYAAQTQTVATGTNANAMTADVASKIAAGTLAANSASTAQAQRDSTILAELVKHTALLTEIREQLKKGLLVKTVAAL